MTIFALGVPAWADDNSTNPFDFDSSRWISFDHYKEKTKHGQAYVEDAPPVAAAPAPAAETSAAQPVVLAAPTRPLNPPLMPGVNKDFDIAVSSTADDIGPMAEIANLASKPTVQLPAFNWQNAAKAAKQYAKNPDSANGDHSLDIRMSYLPEINMPPVVKPNPDSTKARIAAVRAQHQKAIAKKTTDDAAACAAVDAYKKQQLDAIQSDRQTLQALQTAITQLGLQKQLNFMAGANGSVAASDDTTTSAAKADVPESTVK